MPILGGPLGSLNTLPMEIRDQIYRNVLMPIGSEDAKASRRNWGKSRGICTSILASSRDIHREATPLLYSTHFIVPLSASTGSELPPASALVRMESITLEINYSTVNRGDCEMTVKDSDKLKSVVEYVGLSLRHSTRLRNLTICLLNQTQRKRGTRELRSELVRNTIRGLLRLFAVLPRTVSIEVTGFDTLDYVEMFDEIRSTLADSDMSVEELCELSSA